MNDGRSLVILSVSANDTFQNDRYFAERKDVGSREIRYETQRIYHGRLQKRG